MWVGGPTFWSSGIGAVAAFRNYSLLSYFSCGDNVPLEHGNYEVKPTFILYFKGPDGLPGPAGGTLVCYFPSLVFYI